LFAGPRARDAKPGHSVDASVNALLRAGVPPNKVALGIPFYGRATAGVPDIDTGLFQRGSPDPIADWGGDDGIDYRELVARRPEDHGFHRHWSDEAQVPWLYDPDRGIWLSFDDPRSIARKASYAREKGLAGVMIWDLFADDGSLLAAVVPRDP
jgi:chitinase